MTDYSALHSEPTLNRNNVPGSAKRKDSGYHDMDGLDLKILGVSAVPSSTRIACTLVRYVQNSRDEPLHISVLKCRELEIPEAIKSAVAHEYRQTGTKASPRRSLDIVIGHMFSASVMIFCRTNHVPLASLDLISFSGHWLALAPMPKESEALTASMITAQTGITSVTGFRVDGLNSQHHASAIIPRFLEEELRLTSNRPGATVDSISLSYQGLETLLGRLIRTPKTYTPSQPFSSRIIICGHITPGTRWDELQEQVLRFTCGERLLPVIRFAMQERHLPSSHQDRRSNTYNHTHSRDKSWRSIIGIEN